MIPTFWKWLWRNERTGRSGLRLLLNYWIFFHALIGIILTCFMTLDPFSFASKALFPAASILIGMAIAWTSRAATVLQDSNFREKVINKNLPLEDYLYSYQLSLLVIIITVIYVSIMAGGGFNFFIYSSSISQNLSSFWLYFLLSSAIRECWGVINFSNLLTLLHEKIPR